MIGSAEPIMVVDNTESRMVPMLAGIKLVVDGAESKMLADHFVDTVREVPELAKCNLVLYSAESEMVEDGCEGIKT